MIGDIKGRKWFEQIIKIHSLAIMKYHGELSKMRQVGLLPQVVIVVESQILMVKSIDKLII